jgi:hypothetical protein
MGADSSAGRLKQPVEWPQARRAAPLLELLVGASAGVELMHKHFADRQRRPPPLIEHAPAAGNGGHTRAAAKCIRCVRS